MSKELAQRVHIVGAGLAGSEAAHYLASRGISVIIHEMRPTRMTEAHQTGACAELVCSNSLKSKDPLSAPGMMKAEMSRVGSLVLESAAKAEVPAGQALGVDRDLFSAEVTRRLREHPLVEFAPPGEVAEPPAGEVTLIATGPLTSERLSDWLARATDGGNDLYFYDAIAISSKSTWNLFSPDL
jgi:methylenetetrahydrofolate--tRNA-(uracil-5-)-methyltransferase